jgi:hypothetical protein
MKTAPSRPLRDQELLGLLADDPELLAIADAVVSTQAPAAPEVRSRARSLAWLVAAALLLGAALAAGLTLPWNRSPSLVDRALAAVGDQPVFHVVIARPADERGTLVEIATGKPIERTERIEIWFDHGRDLKKTITTLDGQVVDETLETDQGGFSLGGPLVTCAWIAAHPIEATKMRVSCKPSGENGTVPHKVPEKPPTLDESLTGFIDHYQSALASGHAHEVGRGRIDGRDVVWLELPDVNAAPGRGLLERVAVDASTYKPVLVESGGGATTFRVLTAETVAFDRSLFTKPKQVATPVGGSTTSSTDVSPPEAAAALGGTALWLGSEWRGFRLVETKRDELSIGFGVLSDRKPTYTTGVELVYGRPSADGSVDKDTTLTLFEATTCTVVWGWACNGRDPTEPGTMRSRIPSSLVRVGDLYITILDWHIGSQQPTALEVARALRPVS